MIKSSPELKINICIATYERYWLLVDSLDAIAEQTYPPAQIIISDASLSCHTRDCVAEFAADHPDLDIRHVQSKKKALPWQRWWAFTQGSACDFVLFLDDDVKLAPSALLHLAQTYEDLAVQGQPPAGLGFPWATESGVKLRRPHSFKERWLGIVDLPPGAISPGGLTVAPHDPKADLTPVNRFWGGGMGYRYDVIQDIGPLEGLVALYEQRIGRGEDAVLSFYARRYGPLYTTGLGLAIHPPEEDATHTAYATGGWRKGMAETWGRAHTQRWMSTDRGTYIRDWARVASLEVMQAIWWGVLRHPLSIPSWLRLGGALWGIVRTVIHWRHIPETAFGPHESA